ncbi:hypothetical protein BH09ACT10_BH09ACT10_01060 [soil metagenome]
MDAKKRRSEPEAVSITSAPIAQSDDMWDRQKKYVISMGIRTLCFIGAVAFDGPLRWVLLAGAIFLPYIAVILANAGVRKVAGTGDFYTPEPFGELPTKTPQSEKDD